MQRNWIVFKASNCKIAIVGAAALFSISCNATLEPSRIPDGDAEQPPEIAAPEPTSIYKFDGYWILNATLDPGQPVVGTVGAIFWVEHNNPSCVRNGRDELRWTDGFRPITTDGDSVQIRYRADFLPSSNAGFDIFEGESKVETTIVGRRIDDGDDTVSTYDVLVVEHYIFSDVQLTSTGTLSKYPWSDSTYCETVFGERVP